MLRAQSQPIPANRKQLLLRATSFVLPPIGGRYRGHFAIRELRFGGASVSVGSTRDWRSLSCRSCSPWRIRLLRFWRLGLEQMGPGEAEKDVGDGNEVVTCSVCLEAVTGGGGRATARLLCRHQFHLDCIGSAFNVKGVMECPNCREVEKGCWLYANGPHTQRQITMGERIHDGELFNFHHIEMPFGVQWCPIGRLATIPLPFEPGASNSTIQSLVPLYPRAPVSINQQDYYRNLQNTPGSMVPPMPQAGGLRIIRLAAQPLPDHARYFLFPPMSGPNTMGGDEIIPRQQFYTWECERFTPYPLVPFHVESSGWRPFAQPTNGGRPESLIRAPVCLARMHS